jgi:hypothetical protein
VAVRISVRQMLAWRVDGLWAITGAPSIVGRALGWELR